MRNGFTGLLLCLAPFQLAHSQEAARYRWLAFGQLTAEQAEGAGAQTFDVARLRPRFQIDAGPLTTIVQLDLAVDDPGGERPGTLANFILDLSAHYRFSNRHSVRIGQFKTPLGMDFNVPAHALDITKRGMETALVLNRDLGVMLSGERVLGGFSFDIGVFNPAGRSGATRVLDSQVGQNSTAVARLRYDRSEWHAQMARGISEEAGGPGSSDYSVTDLALRYEGQPWTFKAEWTAGRDVLGIDRRRESVYYLHGGYDLTSTFELVARHYRGRSRIDGISTDLTNTYFGITKRFEPQQKLRTQLQVNYVLAAGDRSTYSGLLGFRDNALLLQLQIYIDNS